MGAMKVWDGSSWQTVAPFSERASVYVGPTQPAGTSYAGDMWWDTDEVTPVVGQELSYTERTSDLAVTANTEATAIEVITSGARTYDGTPIMLEFFTARYDIPSSASGGQLLLLLFDGSTNLGWWQQALSAVGSTAPSTYLPSRLTRRLVPTPGTHTYRVMAWAINATATIYGGVGTTGDHVPAFLRITRA